VIPPTPSDAAPNDPPQPLWSRWFYGLIAVATVIIAVVARVVDLDRTPGELYGDIAIVYEYVADIRARRWPTAFVLSAGPLYHYTVAPVLALTGMSYLGFKLASVIVSLLALVTLYGLGRQLHSVELGLLSAFVGAVGSWLLIFSRLGNSQIIIPLLTTSALIFVVRLAKEGRNADVIGCAFVGALGLYTYPQTFILPPVLWATLLCLVWTRMAVRPRHLVWFVLWTIPFALPFGFIVAQDPANFFTGYIGGKLETTANPLATLALNFRNAMGAFNVRGDSVFRSNPPSMPHLDALSGVLWLIGIVFWLLRPRWRLAPAIFVPFVLLQVPSMLVLSFPAEVPSASRTLGVAPLAYLLVASGLWSIAAAIRHVLARWFRAASLIAGVAVVGALALVATLNLERYWGPYVTQLPDDNTPFGRIIAEYIDRLPGETTIYVIGCCWGEWSQPEPKSIQYSTRTQRPIRFVDTDKITCEELRAAEPTVVIWNPNDALPAPQLAPCASLFKVERHLEGDKRVFHASSVAAP
jgi:hypothetical protein